MGILDSREFFLEIYYHLVTFSLVTGHCLPRHQLHPKSTSTITVHYLQFLLPFIIFFHTYNYSTILFPQGLQGGGGAHARLEHPRGTPGPGPRALEELPGSQQVLALRPRTDLHDADGDVTTWERHCHLDIWNVSIHCYLGHNLKKMYIFSSR